MVSRDPRRTRSEQDLALPDASLAGITGKDGQGTGASNPGGEFYTAVGPDGELQSSKHFLYSNL